MDMEEVDYNIILFDAQYFLVRNFEALKSRKHTSKVAYMPDSLTGYIITEYTFDSDDLVMQFFWTIAKFVRENFSCNKILLAWDRAPYYRTSIINSFKADRDRPTLDKLKEFDKESDPQGYLQLEEDVRMENIKSQAKYWIINHLNDFGMPSIIQEGYEADDIAYLFSKYSTELYDKTNKKSAICSIDSDWMFWINNKVDFLNFGSKEAWTEEDVFGECSNKPQQYNLNLYDFKTLIDSTFNSHNNLPKCTDLTWKDLDKIYSLVYNEPDPELMDYDLLSKNIISFDIEKFPEFYLLSDTIKKLIYQKTKLKGIDHYNELKRIGFKVSYSYCVIYLDKLSPDYYELQ